VRDFPTKKLALRELEARVAPINSTSYRALRAESFAQFAKDWEKRVLSQHKPSTQSSTKSQIRTALVPYFGAFLMKDINWHTVQSFIQACTKAPKTCRNYIGTLQMMWRAARAGGWVARDTDPFEDLVMPKPSAPKDLSYTGEEANRIIAAAEGQYKTLYWIAAETGMRPGELCGLATSDLNLPNLTVRVRHSVWGGQLQTPKTANALRNLAISPQLAEHLRGYLSQWNSNPLGLLFLSTVGKPLHPSSVRRDHLEPLCRRLGIKPKGLKAFRHCGASMMDQAGVPLKVRQERLGHAPGSKATLVHYTHSMSEDGRIAAAKMGELLTAAVQ
jgi:integrase